ncbi:MAG: NAD(+) synthase [Clostridia bacterium]|nr:NAD(+) synthase [Clostridia bacterium]
MKVLCAPMETELAQPEKNATKALFIIEANKTVDYILFPPLFLTGSTCGSLYQYSFFTEQQNTQLARIISAMPERVVCVSTIIDNGVEVPVMFNSDGVLDIHDINVALSLKDVKARRTNFLCFKHIHTIGSVEKLLCKLRGTVTFFTSCGKGESGARFVYSGACGGVYEDMATVRCHEPVVIDDREGYDQQITEPDIYPNPIYPFVPVDTKYLDEAIDIMTYALRRRLDHMGSDKVVIGVSGGLDSTLALLIAVNAIRDTKNILGVNMPGLGSTEETANNANILMEGLNVESRTISIEDAVYGHFKDIGHSTSDHDLAYENAQARERMQVLFDLCNMEGAINLGTSDMSEMMLGFTTFGGDHISMFNVNAGVPKTLVRALVLRFAQKFPRVAAVLTSIATAPISPELLPEGQETEAILGTYKANDFAIYHTRVSRMGRKELQSLLDMVGLNLNLDNFYRRITSSQFKRNCCVDGVQVTGCCAMPGGDFDIPSDCKNIF